MENILQRLTDLKCKLITCFISCFLICKKVNESLNIFQSITNVKTTRGYVFRSYLVITTTNWLTFWLKRFNMVLFFYTSMIHSFLFWVMNPVIKKIKLHNRKVWHVWILTQLDVISLIRKNVTFQMMRSKLQDIRVQAASPHCLSKNLQPMKTIQEE